MKLVYSDTKQEVKVGDKRTLPGGEKVTVSGIKKPHKPESTGRVYVRQIGDSGSVPANERGFFPGVIGAEWIEREDHGWINLSEYLKPGQCVSNATMRSRDLIPAFMEAIESVDPEKAKTIREHEDNAAIFKALEDGKDPEVGELAERCSDFVNEELFDVLYNYCLPFHYFGSHEGDLACYGSWFSSESFEDAVRYGSVLKCSEKPDDVEGDYEYIAVVNDQGNITLYSVRSGQEIWSIV